MKILSASEGHDTFELEILEHLKRQASTSDGTNLITMLGDQFEHEGPNGRHRCLLFNPMGESLASFRNWFPNKQLPSPLVQKFTKQILQALSFAHGCGVIHTGTPDSVHDAN
jgi:serine/threonine-protein kinase SRPK3